MLLSDAGGTSSQPNPVTNVTLRFDDASASIISQTNKLTSGTYRPVNYAFPNPNSGDTFVAPAPLPPYTNTALSSFNGMSPNGTWSLFVYDDTAGEDGGISGWSLNIQTSDPVSPAASVSLADMALAATAPSAVTVGGNLQCTFVITNRGPAIARNVALLENMPAGLTFVSANATAGSWSKVQNTFTWTVGDLPSGGNATLVVVGRPTTTGTLASSASVSANQIDPNTANNSITLLTTVTAPPSLSITRQQSTLRIAWPASSGFKLQTTDSLNPASWSDVGITPQNVNGDSVVMVGVGQSGKFYRLRSP
jgi:large repetitive protein